MSVSVVPASRSPRPTRSRASLRWRLRRWIRLKVHGVSRKEPWEPQTEWGRGRQAEREHAARVKAAKDA